MFVWFGLVLYEPWIHLTWLQLSIGSKCQTRIYEDFFSPFSSLIKFEGECLGRLELQIHIQNVHEDKTLKVNKFILFLVPEEYYCPRSAKMLLVYGDIVENCADV